MVKLMKNIKLGNNENLLENGFIQINNHIYRKHIIIGHNIGMYITIGIIDKFLNIATINEQFLSPYDLEANKTLFNETCINAYNNEIEKLIEINILA